MHTFRTEGSAPRTAREFRAAVIRGCRKSNPDARVEFTSPVERHPGRANQPVGTVSFCANVALVVGDYHERFIASSFRYGGDVNGRTGSGSVSITHGSLV